MVGGTRPYETIFCRGGFHQKDITITNNLDKPAPTPRIIHFAFF